MLDQIFSYREMCDAENIQTLQRGMNFHLNPHYSVILMSQRTNAPYRDKIFDDGITIEYEGHDEAKSSSNLDPKTVNQPRFSKNGRITQNGKFIEAVNKYKISLSNPEKVKVYEKLFSGVWSLKGLFDLIDYKTENDGKRNVFIFRLRLSNSQNIDVNEVLDLSHTRLISSEIKKEVWQRDKGICVKCGSNKNLHFDHDLPFSKGGTSLLSKNIRLLCAKCNLAKSNKIE
jgi:5-methylcytosine-specific restriction endonuclease McrA